MTARTLSSPRRLEALLPPTRRSSDRAVMWTALCCAAVIHAVALLLPLPRGAAIAAPTQPERPPIELLDYVFPPPPPPDAPAVAPAESMHRIPLPMTEVLDVEPLVEPLNVATVDSESDPYPDWVDRDLQVAPPESPPPFYEVTNEGVVAPVGLPGRAQPDYPAIGRIAGLEGRVVLQAVITENGDVASIEVLSAPVPDAGFSEAAIAAVSTWKYEPGLYRGRPVAVRMTVFIDFDLN